MGAVERYYTHTTWRVKPGHEFSAWRWCDLDDLILTVAPFRRAVYEELRRLAGVAGL